MGRIEKYNRLRNQAIGVKWGEKNNRVDGKIIWKKPWKHTLYINNRKVVLKSIINEKWSSKKKTKYVKWKGIRLNLYHYRLNDKLLKLETKGKKEGWKFERPIWGLKEGYRILNIATANIGGLWGINKRKNVGKALWEV